MNLQLYIPKGLLNSSSFAKTMYESEVDHYQCHYFQPTSRIHLQMLVFVLSDHQLLKHGHHEIWQLHEEK